MTRPLTPILVGLMLTGCRTSQSPANDPFFPRTTIPPPPTGAATDVRSPTIRAPPVTQTTPQMPAAATPPMVQMPAPTPAAASPPLVQQMPGPSAIDCFAAGSADTSASTRRFVQVAALAGSSVAPEPAAGCRGANGRATGIAAGVGAESLSPATNIDGAGQFPALASRLGSPARRRQPAPTHRRAALSIIAARPGPVQLRWFPRSPTRGHRCRRLPVWLPLQATRLPFRKIAHPSPSTTRPPIPAPTLPGPKPTVQTVQQRPKDSSPDRPIDIMDLPPAGMPGGEAKPLRPAGP